MAGESTQSVQHGHYSQLRILRGSDGKDRGALEGLGEYNDATSTAAFVEK